MDVQGCSLPATEGEAAPLCVSVSQPEDSRSLLLNNYFLSFEFTVFQIRRHCFHVISSPSRGILCSFHVFSCLVRSEFLKLFQSNTIQRSLSLTPLFVSNYNTKVCAEFPAMSNCDTHLLVE